MQAGVDDVETDVPMLVTDQQPTFGGRRVFVNGSCLDSDSPTAVLYPISEDVGVVEYEEEPVEDSENKMALVPERHAYDSKIGIEFSRDKLLEGRKAEMEDVANHHVFDEVPEGDAVGKKFTRGKVAGRRQRRESTRHGDRCIRG